MPIIFGTTITAVTYNAPLNITVDGRAFGINQYPISDVETSLSGAGVWTAVAAINSWSDTQVLATLGAPLVPGDYDVRITSSDGEQNTLGNAISIAGNMVGPESRQWIGIGISC